VNAILAASHNPASAYDRILGWTSVAPIVLLIVLLIELELVRTHRSREVSRATPTMMVLVAPASLLVVFIGVVRAVKLVT
jgi:hypothetical protein